MDTKILNCLLTATTIRAAGTPKAAAKHVFSPKHSTSSEKLEKFYQNTFFESFLNYKAKNTLYPIEIIIIINTCKKKKENTSTVKYFDISFTESSKKSK